MWFWLSLVTARLFFLRGPGPAFSERDRALLTSLLHAFPARGAVRNVKVPVLKGRMEVFEAPKTSTERHLTSEA